jgi:shikimate 5-dehydrogenase
MIDEGILAKESRMIALYGVNAQTSPFLKRLNAAFKHLGLNDYAIGLNIKPEDFSYMVKGMPSSKVTMALYEPEYQEEVVPLLDLPDGCTRQSGLCDGAVAEDGKLVGVCFWLESFERMCACEGVSLQGRRILLLGAGAVGRALLPLFGVMEAAFIEVADTAVERAAEALESAKSSLVGTETDVSWFQKGMAVEAERYDVIVNAIDLYAHEGVRLIDLRGENPHLTLIDFVRGKSAFDTLAAETGGRKIGGEAYMTAQALSVAHKWLDAEISCDDYEAIKQGA